MATDENANNVVVIQLRPFVHWLFNELHKPLEDLDVAVDANVDIFEAGHVHQVGVEVFHLLRQQGTLAREVLIDFPALVTDVDHDLLVACGLRSR
jgi:hypothetical protein